MRDLIQIIESGQTVYHGGSDPLSYFPIFVTPDIEAARAYAEDRGGHLYSFSYHPSRVAGEADIRAAADELGLDHDQDATYVLVSPNVDTNANRVIAVLRGQGYDSAEFNDFAPNDDFKEIPAIVIFDHGALSSPVLLERAEVITVKPMYQREKQVHLFTAPSRSDMIRAARGHDGAQLRGLMFRDGWCVWPAAEAVHHEVVEKLGRDGEFDDTDTPGEGSFYVRVEAANNLIFIGNPEFAAQYIPGFTRLFDHIDMQGDDENPPYEPTEWGLPGRYGGWSHVIG